MRWRFRLRPVVFSLLFLRGPVAACWSLFERDSRRQSLERTLSDLAARGESFDLDVLKPKVFAGQRNGAADFLSAISKIHFERTNKISPFCEMVMARVGSGAALVLSRTTNWPGSSEIEGDVEMVWRGLPELLQQNQEALAGLQACRMHDTIVVHQGYGESPFSVRSPHLGDYKRANQLILCATLLDLRTGSGHQVPQRLINAVKLLGIYRGEYTVISQLVRHAVARMLAEAIWESFQVRVWSEPQLVELQNAWRDVEFAEPLVAAGRFERAMGLIEWRGLMKSATSVKTVSESFKRFYGEGFWEDPARNADYVFWLYWHAHQDAEFLVTEYQRLTEAMEDLARLKSRRGVAGRFDYEPSPHHRFSRILYPASSRFADRLAQVESIRSIALAAVAVERFRIRNSRLPERLADLRPQYLSRIPVDWFDGRHIRFRRVGLGQYLIYSVGENRIDDGGSTTGEEERWFDELDLVWPIAGGAAQVEDARRRLSGERVGFYDDEW